MAHRIDKKLPTYRIVVALGGNSSVCSCSRGLFEGSDHVGLRHRFGFSVARALAAVNVENLAGHEARRLEIEDRLDDMAVSPMWPTGCSAPSAS